MTAEPIPIVVGLVWLDDRLLVGQRAPSAVLGGLAEFPGGKCAPGESPRDAVVREVLEETGIAVTAAPRLEIDYRYPHGWLRLYFFDCLPKTAAFDLAPRPPFRWVAVGEIASLPFPPANDAVLDSLRRFPHPIKSS